MDGNYILFRYVNMFAFTNKYTNLVKAGCGFLCNSVQIHK